MKSIGLSDFEQFFLKTSHWIDVRSPIEFKAGSIPGAVNLPLLSDEERHQIGLTYKRRGQSAAINLGHQLVSGSVRKARIQAWISEIEKNPESIIFCFRGGLRSQIVQDWLKEHKIYRPIVEGGYKALRNFLMDKLLKLSQELKFLVVSGPTGSGKTNFINSNGNSRLDLECLAKHRGSAFGALDEAQPSQADFENLIAVELIQLSKKNEIILIEDESRMIGSRCIPAALYRAMKNSKRIFINLPLEDRVQNILRDYVLCSSLGTSHDLKKFDDFRKSIVSISRKLGGQRAQEILNDIDFCQARFESTGDLDINRVWIRKLLLWYYDPFYKRSREGKKSYS